MLLIRTKWNNENRETMQKLIQTLEGEIEHMKEEEPILLFNSIFFLYHIHQR